MYAACAMVALLAAAALAGDMRLASSALRARLVLLLRVLGKKIVRIVLGLKVLLGVLGEHHELLVELPCLRLQLLKRQRRRRVRERLAEMVRERAGRPAIGVLLLQLDDVLLEELLPRRKRSRARYSRAAEHERPARRQR